MAADPYGFAGAPAPGGREAQALYAGVAALVAAAVGPCVCYLPYLAALPLGAWAVYTGLRLRGRVDAAQAPLVNGAIVSGGVAVALCAAVIALLGAYAVVIGAMLAFDQGG